MRESREALLIVPDPCYPDAVRRGLRGRRPGRSEPVRAGVEAMVAMAELNPKGARAALWRLQTDWQTLKHLEQHLGGEPDPGGAADRRGDPARPGRARLARPAAAPAPARTAWNGWDGAS